MQYVRVFRSVFVDWVMRKIIDRVGTGIRWKITTSLRDLDIVDDLVVFSSKFTVRFLEKICRLKRNGGKGTALKNSIRKLN